MPLYLGLDLGTSACRGILIDDQGHIQAQYRHALPATEIHVQPTAQGALSWIQQEPRIWWQSVGEVLNGLLTQKKSYATQIQSLSIDATSATTLLCRDDGTPLGPALMYNDNRAKEQAETLQRLAGASSNLTSATSSLAKALWLREHYRIPAEDGLQYTVLHQADWICGNFLGHYVYSDWNNSLKLGFDSRGRSWPDWIQRHLNLSLPKVVAPGTILGLMDPAVADSFGLSGDISIVAGTTDSTAGVIASGAKQAGDAITTLGSTLVLKVISDRPIQEQRYGIYSQPIFEQWLVGGASNSGGAVLKHFFSQEDITALSRRMSNHPCSGLDYYPLLQPGERFPINNPNLAPRLSPRPDDPLQFFQGLLEGIAYIEKMGYDRLAELGAPQPKRVISMGGGAINQAWCELRSQVLGIPVSAAQYMEAAYGAALLARRPFHTLTEE